MAKLASHFARANAAMDRVETETVKSVDKLIERTEHFHKRREQVFQKKHEGLDAQMGDLAEFESELEDYAKNDRGDVGTNSEPAPPSNGANALPASWEPKADRSTNH